MTSQEKKYIITTIFHHILKILAKVISQKNQKIDL